MLGRAGSDDGYLPHIDGLRALAVATVLLFHAFPSLLPGGFIGVDVFFVISGFLITRIIVEGVSDNTFSLTTFYARRIRRLFPALLVVFAACVVTGAFIMTPGEYRLLGTHLLAGAGFVSNIVLWTESSYFDASAEMKPLLHLWSLGIEEQFYLFWPLLLAALMRRGRQALLPTCLLVLASFVLNVALVVRDPVATFYLPFTRIWELLAGAALALSGVSARLQAGGGKAARNVLALAGMAVLAAGLAFVSRENPFPGYWALLPVLGTLLLLAAGPQAWVNRHVLAHPWMVWVGLISYPLYLWHWPLLSFGYIHFTGAPPVWWRVVALLLSLLLAWVTYRWLERPLRHGGNQRRRVAALASGMVCIALVGAVLVMQGGFPGRPGVNIRLDEHAIEQERLNYWKGSWDTHFGERGTNVLVFGDSQGFDVYKVLSLDERLGVRNFESSFDCTAFNQPILGKETQASRCQELFERLFAGDVLEGADVLVYTFSWFHTAEPADALAHYHAAVERLRARNPALKIVFIGPKPWLGRTWVSINAITRHLEPGADVNAFLNSIRWIRDDDIEHVRALAEQLGVEFIDASQVYCHGGCTFFADGQFAYFDQNHWTGFGARLFHQKLNATGAINTLLRSAPE